MPFLKIFLLIYLSYTLPSSAERRAGEDRENNGTTPRQQKVLFVNICHRHWLFSARGFPREKSPPFFVHYPENIRDILVPRLLLCSRGSARNLILTPTPKHPKYSFFPCSIQKFSLSLRPILKDTNETRTFTSQSNVRPRDCRGIVGA